MLLLLIIHSNWCSEIPLVPDTSQERYNYETDELEIATQKTSDCESDSEDQQVPRYKKREENKK